MKALPDDGSKPMPAETPGPPFRWRTLIGMHTFLLAGLLVSAYVISVAASAYFMLSPTGKDDQYAVVLPPWFSPEDAAALALSMNGLVIDMNDRTNIALLYVKRPDAVAALYRSGAWLVLDPEKMGGLRLGGLCTAPSPAKQRPLDP